MKVEDLDALRPEPKVICINKKEIDVSFVPCGITFDLEEIMDQLRSIKIYDIPDAINSDIGENEVIELKNKNKENMKKAFDLSLDLCAVFCSHKYPELDKDYFMFETDAIQVEKLVSAIKDALNHAYDGVNIKEGGSKNSKAAKKKK